MTCPATTSRGWPCRSYMASRKNGSMTIIMQNAAALLLAVRLSKSSRLGNGRSSSISVASHTTHRAVRQWAVQSYSRPDRSAAFSPFRFCVNPSVFLSSKPWLRLGLDPRRTITWNAHSNRQIGLFGPFLFPGTMASADFLE